MHCWRSSHHLRGLAASSDDDVQIVLRYKGPGARGMLWAEARWRSATKNGLKLRILRHQGRAGMDAGRPELSVVHRFRSAESSCSPVPGAGGALPEAARVSRLPGGHPRVISRGFATIYAEAARAIRAARGPGASPLMPETIYPTVA